MWLNKALPCVFAITGLGIACIFDSLLGFESGLLLMLIACLIWMKRLEHRPGQFRDTQTDSGNPGDAICARASTTHASLFRICVETHHHNDRVAPATGIARPTM